MKGKKNQTEKQKRKDQGSNGWAEEDEREGRGEGDIITGGRSTDKGKRKTLYYYKYLGDPFPCLLLGCRRGLGRLLLGGLSLGLILLHIRGPVETVATKYMSISAALGR